MNKHRVLIVDDEHLARKSLSLALSEFKEIEILGECANGFEAVKAIKEKKPDIVFLDIQMPKLDGFDVLELLGENPPFIVFVTAYDQYAVRAFESHALDYILKPASPERLKKAIQKVWEHLRLKQSQPVGQLLNEHLSQHTPIQRILVRDRTDITIIPVEEVVYFEAQDDYVCIHTKEKAHLKKQTLSNLDTLLDSRQFIRIHRSYILNINHLKKIEPYSKDSRIAKLKTGIILPVSRSGYSRILKLI
jgi:two-component system LytT family response regulator